MLDAPPVTALTCPPVSDDYTEDDDSREDVRAGKSPGDIKETDKYEFLQLMRQGLNRARAAEVLGFYGRHFRAICSPLSPFYDEEFAASYGEVRGSLEHAEGRLERLQAEAERRALAGSDRLLEKLLMVHDPDWKKLRENNTQVEVNVRHFIETHFKSLNAVQIQELIDALDRGEEIPVDAEYTPIGEIEQGDTS